MPKTTSKPAAQAAPLANKPAARPASKGTVKATASTAAISKALPGKVLTIKDPAKDAKAAAKKKSRKGLRDASDPNLHKRLASDRISADVADFERAGGTVEKLGVTKVLLKIPLV